jgi:hypothetical protein
MRHDLIEEMVVKEFMGLCSTCAHVHSCAYSERRSDKVIIQCEMFEVDHDNLSGEKTPSGLCRTCDLTTVCRLPGRKTGTWHCNEFQ